MGVRTAGEKQREVDTRLTLLERALAKRGNGTIRHALLDPAYVERDAYGPARVTYLDKNLRKSPSQTQPLPWATEYRPGASRVVKVLGGTILGQDANISESAAGEYPVTLQSSWWLYNEVLNESSYQNPKLTVLPSGYVMLSGMLRYSAGKPADGTPILSFPAELGPDVQMILPAQAGDTYIPVNVMPTGSLTVRTGNWPTSQYLSLDGIGWWMKGVPQWTEIGAAGTADPVRFSTNFDRNTSWDAQYGIPAYWKDPYGFLWFRGIVRSTVAGLSDNANVVVLPTSLRGALEQHILSVSNDVFGYVGSQPTNGVNWKTGNPNAAGNWLSLSGVMVITQEAVDGNNWQPIPFAAGSGWALSYGPQFPSAAALCREDGLRILRGLVNAGTPGTTMFRPMPELAGTRGRLVLLTVASAKRARFDMGSAIDDTNMRGRLIGVNGEAWTGAAGWFSMDSVKFVP